MGCVDDEGSIAGAFPFEGRARFGCVGAGAGARGLSLDFLFVGGTGDETRLRLEGIVAWMVEARVARRVCGVDFIIQKRRAVNV